MDLVKEWSKKIIKQTCEILNQPEDIVTAVHQDQWKRAKSSAKECNQIEFSGLGRFTTKAKKIDKQLIKYTNLFNAWIQCKKTETDLGKLHALDTKLTQMEAQIENLEKRIKRRENENKC